MLREFVMTILGRLILFIFCSLYSLFSFSQTDTEFWFAVPEVTSLHGDRPIFLRMATLDSPADITISIPANSNFTPINISIAANAQDSVNLTPFIDSLEIDNYNTVTHQGLHISSTSRISAYYEVLGTNPTYGIVNSDLFILKGKNALGTQFYTPFQNFWNNQQGIEAWSTIDIVATENNTTVEITLTQYAYENIPPGTPITITLNRGETYSIRVKEPYASLGLSGSYVEADKPIAVTIKDDSILQGGAYDLAGDQLVPVELTGNQFVLFSPDEFSSTNHAFIVATENGTKLYLNGSNTAFATINEGQTFDRTITNNIEYIRTSAPVYVFQITGLNNELGGALLPAFGECTGSPKVSLIRTSEQSFIANILIPKGAEDYFEFDGNPNIVTGNQFSTVPGTNNEWVYAQIDFPTSVVVPGNAHSLTNDSADFHLGVMIVESNVSFRYGYFSNFAAGVELGNEKAFCPGDSVTLDAGVGKNDYLWNTGATTPTITVKDSGTYYVTASRDLCVFEDTVYVRWYPEAHEPILYDDTSFCEDLNYTLKIDTGFVSSLWNTGSKKPTIKPDTAGMYKVDVSNRFGCATSDSVTVEIYTLPSTAIHYEQDQEKFCLSDIVTLEADPGFVDYLWNTGDNTQVISTPHLFDYWVEVTDGNGCTNKTSVFTDCTLFITVPNTFTPNNDGINDYFILEGLPGDGWTLTIISRWGEQVYKKEGYDNSWNGDGQPDGTYYYLLENQYNDTVYKGWLQLLR